MAALPALRSEVFTSSAAEPWDLTCPPRTPVARPQLAPVEAALPYLRQIDDARTYSNYGPLNARLEARLAGALGVDPDCVVTCSSGTVGLTLALMAATGGANTLCLMPSWTFPATAHAAVAAGLLPFLTDVDPVTGALTPEIAEAALAQAPGEVTAVVPVAPFGLPLDLEAWDRFEARTGVAVVIDAAAGFDGLRPGRAPAVVSLHATKVLGIGEGGFVVARDPGLIAGIRARANFGFAGRREATAIGLNGKLSEYAAAFGLAALDLWPLQRQRWMSVLGYYGVAFGEFDDPVLPDGLGDTWAASTLSIRTSRARALEIESRLAEAGFATRRWWGDGVHAQPAFADAPRMPLPVTEALAAGTIGLPCYPDIAIADLKAVAAIVLGVLSQP